MNRELWAINTMLGRREDLVVVTIISQQGSTPRKAGSKMLVQRDGSTSGTIGGGEVEADVIGQAMQAFVDGQARLLSYDYRRTGLGGRIDLICGGRMVLLLEVVAANESNRRLYSQAAMQLSTGQGCLWQVSVSPGMNGITVKRQLSLLPEENRPLVATITARQEGSSWQLEEILVPGRHLYLVGAGHVGRELARLTVHLGVPTHIIDDREEIVQAECFASAASRQLSCDYHAVFDQKMIGRGDAIVIATRAHRYDKRVLAQALQTDAGYVGMIGSRKKRDTIYTELIGEGVAQSSLARVACPIGLDIGGETPEEIAVSIAAELIQFRAGRYRSGEVRSVKVIPPR